MIPFKHRFHGHNGLRFVYANGKTIRSSLMALRYAQNSRNTDYRCAVIVSKKISKSAVKRNRIRRRIYEIVRKSQDKLAYPADLVFTVYSEDIANLDTSELENTIDKLLSQAKIII